MLIQTLQPLRYLSRDDEMDLQDTQSDSTMSLSAILDSPSQSTPCKNNPMDIRAMLNPSAGESEVSCNKIERQTRSDQFPTNSPKSESGEQQFYLPSMKLEPAVPGNHQFPLAYHLRAGNPSPPLSPQLDCYQQHAFTPTLYHGYPTPPPSSPQYRGLNQPENGSNYMTGPQDPHHLSWEHTESPTPRHRCDEEQRAREAYWNMPVHVHNIHISHSPSYHSHQSVTTSSRRANSRVTKPPKRNRPGPHSNKPYTGEQVHWMRYHRQDLGLLWPQVHALFYEKFPGSVRESVACITSRYYRSNFLPKLGKNGEPMLDRSGKFVMEAAKIRGRATEEGKHKPFLFVDVHPEWALVYDWVTADDKKKAMRVLQILDGQLQPRNGEKSESKFSPLAMCWETLLICW
jgi:hypothetical protein